jgi:hypothetical protein
MKQIRRFVPRCRLMAAMQIRQERFSVLGEARPDRSAMPGGKVESQDSGALISVKTAFDRR